MADSKQLDPLNIRRYFRNRQQAESIPVAYAKPVEIGAFSIDGGRKFRNDRSQLAYLEESYNLAKKMDLNDGYRDRFIKRDENVKERLDHLLRWFVSNLHKFEKKGNDVDLRERPFGPFPDFVLWRGHMTKIMGTPYENQDGWEMAVQRVGSTIYVSEVETKEAEHRRLNQSDKEKVMTYWGVRFEKYMTRQNQPPNRKASKAPLLSAVDQSRVMTNTNEAFCTVLQSKLNSHKIVHSAEVDCLYDPDDCLAPPDNYVELKTSREFSAKRQEENFHRYKTKKWWAQSFLAGVPQVTCGFRTDDGVVVRIRDFKTNDFPRMARNVPGNSWDANVCLQFLDTFFSYVKTTLATCTDEEVVIFTWHLQEDEISCRKYEMPTKHSFLPEWYITSLKYH